MGNFTKKGIKQPFGWEPISIINDKSISMKAKGLWLYMNSKPEGWNFASDRIAEDCSDGRDSIRAGLKELTEHGLLSAKKRQDGTILYILCSKTEAKPVENSEVIHNPKTENPSQGDFPKTENPTVGKSHGGKIRPVSNIEIKVRKNIKKEGAGLALDEPAVAATMPARSNYESEDAWLQARYAANTVKL